MRLRTLLYAGAAGRRGRARLRRLQEDAGRRGDGPRRRHGDRERARRRCRSAWSIRSRRRKNDAAKLLETGYIALQAEEGAGGHRGAAERRRRHARLDAGALGAGARAGDGRALRRRAQAVARSCSRATSSAYAGKLDKGKELDEAARVAAWPKFGELRGALSRGVRAGLDKGFFFVARTRSAVEPQFAAGAVEAPLSLQAGGLPLRSRRQALPPRQRHRRARLRHRSRARRQVAAVPGGAPAAPRERASTASSIRASASSI